MTTAIGASALKVGAGLIPAIGRSVISKAQMARIQDQARSVVVADNVDRFLADLRPEQVDRLHDLVHSPEFASLMLQSMVECVRGLTEVSVGEIRVQVRSALSRWAIFSEADLLQATDVVSELLTASAEAIRTSAGGALRTPHAVAMAARHALVAAQNTDCVVSIDNRKEIEDVVKRLRSQVRSKHAKLRLPSVVIDKRVGWHELYVPARLRPSKLIKPRGMKRDLVQSDLMTGPLGTVVLGNPGAGKSTLASKLVFDISSRNPRDANPQVAIMVPIQKYAERIARHEDDLIELLMAACSASYAMPVTRQTLTYLLVTGRVVLIVDGIDELGEAAKRRDLTEMVESFASAYPRTRIIVTSREIGYDEASLDHDLFPAVIVQPFTTADVERYANHWFKIVDRRELAAPFLVESSRVSDLRESPLILSLLCALYQAEQSLPGNRPDIYARCSALLVETWDTSRGVRLHADLYPFMRRVIQGLAHKLYTDSAQRQALPRRELETFLSNEVLRDLYSTPDEAERAAVNFLDFCANRAWVLTDIGAGEMEPWYGFTHKTFLEYFAASHLVKGQETIADVWNELRPIVLNQDGSVVADLAVQILDRDRTDGASALLTLALDNLHRMREADQSNVLLFAAKALESSAPSTPVLVRVVEQTARQALEGRDVFREPAWPKVQGARALVDLLFCRLPSNKDRISTALANFWSEQFNKFSDHSEYKQAICATIAEVNPAPATSIPGQLYEKFATAEPMVGVFGRIRDAELTPKDVELIGPNSLLRSMVSNLTLWAPVGYRLLERVMVPVRGLEQEAMQILADLLPSIIRLDVPAREPVRTMDSLVEFNDWRWERLEMAPIQAKTSALLLMTAFSRIVGFRGSVVRNAGPAVRSVLMAPELDHLRAPAVEVLNGWQLPGEAHNQMVGWVMGNSSANSLPRPDLGGRSSRMS